MYSMVFDTKRFFLNKQKLDSLWAENETELPIDQLGTLYAKHLTPFLYATFHCTRSWQWLEVSPIIHSFTWPIEVQELASCTSQRWASVIDLPWHLLAKTWLSSLDFVSVRSRISLQPDSYERPSHWFKRCADTVAQDDVQRPGTPEEQMNGQLGWRRGEKKGDAHKAGHHAAAKDKSKWGLPQ